MCNFMRKVRFWSEDWSIYLSFLSLSAVLWRRRSSCWFSHLGRPTPVFHLWDEVWLGSNALEVHWFLLRPYLLYCELLPFVWLYLLISFGGFGVYESPLLFFWLTLKRCSCVCKITVVWNQARRCRSQHLQRPEHFGSNTGSRSRVRHKNKCIYFSDFNEIFDW